MLLVDCVEGGGTLTKTTSTNGSVQMRPKTFSGYVLPKFCLFAISVLASIKVENVRDS